ncbi:MAG: RecX family transcriptional regulator [Gammaproteobacteria bacterium]|nr:RecX family transcriptional regulator [Gammaproteobacteria bacterium]
MARKITGLKLQKRNKNRVNVYLDGEFAFGLSKIVAAWLHTGQELSEEKIADLKSKDEVEKALQRAMNYLSYRPRSEQEVRKNLNKHGHAENVIDEIVERLKRGGLVDDQKFAELWVENRSEFRPRGSYMLRVELRQKGIADQVISNVLEEIDESSLAIKAARKKARRYQSLEWQEFRKKMNGFLARRGFHYGIISEVLPIVWDEISSQTNQ